MLLTYLVIICLQGEPGPAGLAGLVGVRGEPVSKNGVNFVHPKIM